MTVCTALLPYHFISIPVHAKDLTNPWNEASETTRRDISVATLFPSCAQIHSKEPPGGAPKGYPFQARNSPKRSSNRLSNCPLNSSTSGGGMG
uniref:Uncharacterized protein n=1 Tax=Arundo donax TaxID=35708 RepID=A0A0A9F0F7_ARUDO